jgi:hypothetical protein
VKMHVSGPDEDLGRVFLSYSKTKYIRNSMCLNLPAGVNFQENEVLLVRGVLTGEAD